ncbi:hypothetical protein KBP51_14065 [Lactiplantibacillus pentosus]|uniref:hypothetical protein n=1 Tax=Lactiplantibacillus pentosus TaxID=1589 RepID=UPI000AF14F43|nr:hypothetical protein [Lactiplantibacillus pentosus]MBQ0837547.1 hypothetical protein [Lactiplantibacillus pentosus]
MNSSKYDDLAISISQLNEFEWNQLKGKVDYLFNKKASKLQLGREELKQELKKR